MTLCSVYAEISHDDFQFVLEGSASSIKAHLEPEGIHVLTLSIENWGGVSTNDMAEEMQSERQSRFLEIRECLMDRSVSDFVTVGCYLYAESSSLTELQSKVVEILNFADCRFHSLGSLMWTAEVRCVFAYEDPDAASSVMQRVQRVGMTLELLDVSHHRELALNLDVLEELERLDLPCVPSKQLTRKLPSLAFLITGRGRDRCEFDFAVRDLFRDSYCRIFSIETARFI